MGGPGWGQVITVGQPIIAALDIAMVAGGGWMLRRALGRRLSAAAVAPVLEPAE